MNKNLISLEVHQGMPIIALAIVSPEGPEDLPNEVSDRPEEQLPENDPNEAPEVADKEDLGFDEEVGIEGENAFPGINEKEIDQEIGEQEEAKDTEGIPVQPPTAPSDVDENII